MTTPLATLPAPAAPARPRDAPAALARLGGELRVCAVLGIIALPFTVWIAIPLAGRFGLPGFVLAYLAGGAALRAGLVVVELRRLTARHPAARIGGDVRAAIARLKRDSVA